MSQTTQTTQEATQEVEVAKGFGRPDLLTLNGLYSTTKSVYTTYIPVAVGQLIGGVSQSLFKASSPLVVKMIPESASPEWKSLENGDVANIDSLLTSYFTAGDETIDTFLNQSTDRVNEVYTNYKDMVVSKASSLMERAQSVKASLVEKMQGIKPAYENAKTQATEKMETVKTQATEKFEEAKTQATEKMETVKTQATEKFEEAKTQATEKMETVKTQATEKFEEAKTVVQAKLDDERVAAVIEQAKPYIALVKENAEPAKDVLLDLATTAQAEVNEIGYLGYAKESAEVIRDQSLDAFEVCKTKGAVQGVKEISTQVMSNVVNKLEDAKKKKRSGSDEGSSSSEESN